jgi:hypothetical protein
MTILNAKIWLKVTKAERHQECKSALRRARATLRCIEAPLQDDCSFMDDATGIDSEHKWMDWTAVDERHRFEASALLDGFSVEEVTRAGG